MDIVKIARAYLNEPARTSDGELIAAAVLEMVTVLETIASVDPGKARSLDVTCVTIAGAALQKWTEGGEVRE